MDESILSDAKLLEASRDFVCARLVTYESKTEGEFLQKLNRSGNVPNTTFVLIAPDGETNLSKVGRSPRQTHTGNQGLEGLLVSMKRIAQQYPGNGAADDEKQVPYLTDVRRAINVAACDNQPLVIVSIKNDEAREEMQAALANLAWAENFRGRFAFANSENTKQLDPIDGAPQQDSVMVVQPGPHGTTGSLLASTEKFATKDLARLMKTGLKRFSREKSGVAEIKAGQRKGVEWDEEDIESRTAANDFLDSPEKKSRSRDQKKRKRGKGK